jgi:putative ABC transport system permease protein
VRAIGWDVDETVLGKKISYPGDNQKFEVIGVVKDFNYWALQAPIQPMAMFSIKSQLFSNSGQYAALRITGANSDEWKSIIEKIQQKWSMHAGDVPFNYQFVDQSFAAAFDNELKFGQALLIFSSLAILIACLGLLGMIIFTIELRTKEIGIRKVVGASAFNILMMISKHYTRLIAVSVLFSVPVSAWFMKSWLSEFEYRITITPLVFIVAGGTTLVLAILITSYHSLKAAFTNPVDVLKDE